MVEELKLAIKIDDDVVEQSLLKQFNNAEKMADKVVLTFKNINLDDKNIEAKFKEMQKMAGKNPIDLSINDKSLEMLSAINKQLSNIFEIAKGKSLIDSSSTVSDIGKIANATNQQVEAIKKTTSAYKNQAYELASVLKMLEKMDRFNETSYAGAMSKAIKANAKSYKKDDIIQFSSKDYNVSEDALKQLRGLSVDLESAFNYSDTLGLDTATIKNVEVLIQYFRELLKEKLEFNNVKLNTADIEELIKALGIAKKEVFDDGTGKKINSYDGYLNKYSSVSEITAYLKQQEQQSLATAEAEQKLANVQQQSSNSSFAENQDKIQQELKETEQIAEQTAEVLEKVNLNGNKSNISSENTNTNIAVQKQDISSIVKLVDNYGRELDEVNSKLLEGTALLDKQGKLIRLYHGSDVEFDKFDLSKSTNSSNQIYGKGAYLIENEKGAQGYGNVVTQWYANVRAILNEEQQLTLEEAKRLYNEFGNQFMSIFTGKPMDFNEFFDNYLDFNPDETTIVEKMKSLAGFLGKDIGEVLSTIGYDAIKMDRSNGSFYTIFDPDRVIRFKDETQKAIGVVNNLNQAQTKSTIEDVFQDGSDSFSTAIANEKVSAMEKVETATEQASISQTNFSKLSEVTKKSIDDTTLALQNNKIAIDNLISDLNSSSLSGLSSMFNLTRKDIDPEISNDVNTLTKELNKLAEQAVKTNSDTSWEGILSKIKILQELLKSNGKSNGKSRDLSLCQDLIEIAEYFKGMNIKIPKENVEEILSALDTSQIEILNKKGSIENLSELNKQLIQLGVTFSKGKGTLNSNWEEIYTQLGRMDWSEETNNIDQYVKVINELLIARDKIYSNKTLSPVSNDDVNRILFNWLGNIEELSTKIAILYEERKQLENKLTHLTTQSNAKNSAGSLKNINSDETSTIQQVTFATEQAAQAKQDFVTANENVQSSVDGSKSPLQLEAELIDEVSKKASEAAEEITKYRDVIRQSGLKSIQAELDENGNATGNYYGQFSFVERLQDGQTQTVLATYDQATQSWEETVLNLNTAFEQVGKQVIALDDKINQYEMNRDKTLAQHPTYNTSGDEKLIVLAEKRRQVLLDTLSFYSQEAEYEYENSAFQQRRLENDKKIAALKEKNANLEQAKAEQQESKRLVEENIRLNKAYYDGIKEDEKEYQRLRKQYQKEGEAQAKAEQQKYKQQELAVEKQITEEIKKQNAEQQKKWDNFQKENAEENKKAYQELTDTIQQYSEISKRIASGNALDGDVELAQKLEDKISNLQKQDILSPSQIDDSERKLEKLFNQLDIIEKKQANKVSENESKAIEKVWEDNLAAIQEYMDAKTKLNNLEASDKKSNKKSNEIADLTNEVEKARVKAEEARAVLSSMVNPHNADIDTWDKWIKMMEEFRQAGEGSSQSIAKLKDAIANVNTSELQSLDKYIESAQKKLNETNASRKDDEKSSYFKDYIKEIQGYIDAIVAERDKLKASVESGDIEIIDSKNLTVIDGFKDKITEANLKYKTMFKGAPEISSTKVIQKMTKYLTDFTGISKDAKKQIKDLINLLETDMDANPKEVLNTFLKLATAEKAAGRECKSLLDVIKDKAWYGFAAQVGTYFSFNDIMRYGKEGIQVVRELDTALTEMRKVSEESVSSLRAVQDASFDLANSVGTTAIQIQNSIADFMRIGDSVEEAQKHAIDANTLLQVSEFDSIEDATSALVSMNQAWKDVDTQHINDVLNILGNNMPIATDELASSLQRSAGTLATLGATIEEAAALTVAGNNILQDPDSVAAGKILPEHMVTCGYFYIPESSYIGQSRMGTIRPRKDYNICFNY